MIIYKIRTQDGRFSKGGLSIAEHRSFNDKGKSWTNKGSLSLHLSQLHPSSVEVYRKLSCEVVEFEIVEKQNSTVSVNEYLREIAARRAAKYTKAQARAEAFQKEQRHKQFLILQKEFGNE